MSFDLLSKIQNQLRYSPWRFPQSRIHPTASFGDGIWVKRDDELSFGISGTKLRKLASAISYLKSKKVDLVLTTGGYYSNHLPAALQAFHEARLPYKIWLKKAPPQMLAGNYALLRLLANPEHVRWLDHDSWENRYQMMYQEAQSAIANVYVMREGVDNKSALAGAMTLALDIQRNEVEASISFNTIVIDAGSAGTAIGLILGLELLGLRKKVLVVGMAMEKEEFFEKLAYCNHNLPEVFGLSPCEIDYSCIQYTRPSTAKSFGSTNQKVFKEIAWLAKHEGLLVDPVYGAKVTLTVKELLKDQSLKLPLLWVHSGGAFSLSGFWKQLESYF